MRLSLPNSLPQRKSIFKNDRLKKFQNIYQTVFPDFLQKIDQCECLHSMQTCKKIMSLYSNNFLSEAEHLYEKYKSEAQTNQTPASFNLQPICISQKILQPHLKNIMKVIKLQKQSKIQPIYQILRHAKCQYLTFWTYAGLCSKWPTFKEFRLKVLTFAQSQKLDIGKPGSYLQQRIVQLYDSKLANVVHDNYLLVIKRIFEHEDFIWKLASISLLKGRERREDEILKASIQYQ